MSDPIAPDGAGRHRRRLPGGLVTDLAAQVRAARADLAAVTRGLARLWEHLYDPDLPPPEVRTRSRRTGSPALWTDRTYVQRAYGDVLDELARAHWHLGRNSDVPAHWTLLPSDEWVARQREAAREHKTEPLPVWRKPTVPQSEALRWTRILDAMLSWLADNGDPRGAITEAAGHIASARGRIGDLMPEQPIVFRRCKRAGCVGADDKPRVLRKGDGKVCSACRSRDLKQRSAAG